MEVIRSGRHYIDTLVAVTHNRRRRYSKGGTIPDNGERLAYRQNPDSSTAERLEMDENGNIIRPIPTFKPATNTYIDRRNNTAPLLPSMIDTEEGRRRILLSQGIDPDTGQRIEKDKAPLLEDDSTKQYALEQALKLQLEQQQQLQGLTKRYAKGGSIYIKPSKKGTFTAAATKHGESVQEFASQVLANKEDYSPAMVKKANFARNSKRWKHPDGGVLINSQTAPIYSNAYASNNWGFYGSKYTPEEWAALSKSDRNSYIGDAYNDALRSLGYIPGVNNPKEKAEYDRRLIGITGVWNMEEMQKNPGLAYAYESMAGNPIYQSSIYTGEAASGFIYDYPLESKYPTELSTDASKIQSYAMPRYQYVEKLNPVQQSNQNVTESTPPWITDNLYNPNGNTTAQSLQPSTLGTPSSSLNTLINPELTVTNNPKLVYTPISPETDVNVPDDINTKAVVDEMVKSGEVKQRLSGAYTPTTGGNESSITPGAMIGMGIQGAGLLAKGILLGKRNKYMPAEYTPVAPVSFERVNAREPLAQSKSAFAGANTALARNAGSTGQYLSNRIASGVGEGMQRAGIVEQVNNQNAQIQAQEATQNAQIALQNAQRKLQVGEINQQEYDSVTQAWNDYMNDVVGVGAGVTKDVLGYGAQDIALQNLDTANFDYQLINGKWTPIPKQNFGTGLKMDITTTPQTEIKRDGSVATATTTKRKGGYLKNKNKQFIY
jgi:hypothetical protein